MHESRSCDESSDCSSNSEYMSSSGRTESPVPASSQEVAVLSSSYCSDDLSSVHSNAWISDVSGGKENKATPGVKGSFL